VVGEEWIPQLLVNLPITNVPCCVSRNTDTWTAKLAALEVAAGSGLPDRTCKSRPRTEELLMKQHTVSDGQANSSIRKGKGGQTRQVFVLPSFRPG
jgi:hypothetical protein